MLNRRLLLQAWLAFTVAALCGAVTAFPITFSGRLDDPTNPALVGSDLGAPSFDNSVEPIANNVALYTLSVLANQTVTFTSEGYVAGGIDPYFSLFSGTGAGATFLASNFVHAFTIGGDFVDAEALPAGDYTLAIGAFANMSFAENLGTGTLGDGFIRLGVGVGTGLQPYFYQLVVTADGTSTVPEPATVLLIGAALLVAGLARTRNRRVEHIIQQ